MRLIFIKKFCNLSKVGGFRRGEEQSCVKKENRRNKKKSPEALFYNEALLPFIQQYWHCLIH